MCGAHAAFDIQQSALELNAKLLRKRNEAPRKPRDAKTNTINYNVRQQTFCQETADKGAKQPRCVFADQPQ